MKSQALLLLEEFAKQERMLGKGGLCVALVVTRYAKDNGLPLDPNKLVTKGKGQVLGLGKTQVQTILADYGIKRVLAEEGGRTSRGSIGNMEKYVIFLNALQQKNLANLPDIEKWWVSKVQAFFASKPLFFRLDPTKSLQSAVADLLSQADKRQKEARGLTHVGTVLQHLVGAKLELVLGKSIKHYGASVADMPSGRSCDFLVDHVAIHVTTAPGEALIRKCEQNLSKGLRPVIITLHDGPTIAEGLARQVNLVNRIDILDAEQFLVGNLYELGKFAESGHIITATELVYKYNNIISDCESDPSLRIEMA